MHITPKVKWRHFLWDIMMCSLGSYGGPEAHYGVFSSILVHKKKYLTDEELTEMIGLYALVPGPSSTQTITAIGYHVGGPVLALLTFFVWAFPAIVTMGLLGIFFYQVDANDAWKPLLTYLPSVAIAFIFYAAWNLSKKVLKKGYDWILYIIMLILGIILVGYSMWVVPALLIIGGLSVLLQHTKDQSIIKKTHHPRWWILGVIIGLALFNEGLRAWVNAPWVMLYTSFYRYGYSVIGGGQIVIPLMIQDLVQTQSLLSLSDFLSGYAIDQAIPGPLFSFAAFVSSRSFAGTGFALIAGLIGGLSIFLPGILLVFFIFPLWKSMRTLTRMKHFLAGVTVTAASLITMTALTQAYQLPLDWRIWSMLLLNIILLMSKKIPAPFVVIFSMMVGFIL